MTTELYCIWNMSFFTSPSTAFLWRIMFHFHESYFFLFKLFTIAKIFANLHFYCKNETRMAPGDSTWGNEPRNHYGGCWGVCCGLSESHQPHTALGNLGNSVGPFQATTCVGRRKISGLWHQSEGSWKINLTFTIFPPWKSGKHFLDDFLENLSEDWPMVYRKTIVVAFFYPKKK